MAEISFSTGEKTFSLNGKVDVVFNPADPMFLKRIYDASSELRDTHDKLITDCNEAGADKFAITQNKETEMRQIIDDLFGKPVCDAVIPSVSVFGVADGFPIWANLLFAVVDMMDESLTKEKAKAQERIRKYSAKYK